MAKDSSSISSVPLGKAIESFLGSNSASTPAMRTELSRFATLCGKECPLFALPTAEVAEFVRDAKKPAERRKRTEMLVAFFDYAKCNGWVRSNPAASFIQTKKETVQKKAVAPASRQVELSVEGRPAIQNQIERLIGEKSRAIEEVREARADGDLGENAPYHAARERLAMIEAQLREYKYMLSRAVTEE
jgi:hypothetical protein